MPTGLQQHIRSNGPMKDWHAMAHFAWLSSWVALDDQDRCRCNALCRGTVSGTPRGCQSKYDSANMGSFGVRHGIFHSLPDGSWGRFNRMREGTAPHNVSSVSG
jgi:hypothetical protein